MESGDFENVDIYISKCKLPKKNKKNIEKVSAPKIPPFLKRRSSSTPSRSRSTERRRRGGDYQLSSSPRPSYPDHEELHQKSEPVRKRYKLPPTPTLAPKPRKVVVRRSKSAPRQLPVTPLVIKDKNAYVRTCPIEIKNERSKINKSLEKKDSDQSKKSVLSSIMNKKIGK